MTLPQCVFKFELEGETYRCTRPGIGNPPLCREHYEIVQAAEDRPGRMPQNFWDELLDRVLDHPYVQGKVEEVMEILRDPARSSPFYQGPGQAYAAETPPRPREQRKRPRRPPPEPPRDTLTCRQALEILHFSPKQKPSCAEIRKRQRELARLAHPDIGGSDEAMQRINAAATFLIGQTR